MLRFVDEEVELVYESVEGVPKGALSETTMSWIPHPLTCVSTCDYFCATYRERII
jgi:hypothetical protein